MRRHNPRTWSAAIAWATMAALPLACDGSSTLTDTSSNPIAADTSASEFASSPETASSEASRRAQVKAGVIPGATGSLSPALGSLLAGSMHFAVITTQAIKAASANLSKFVQTKQSQGFVVEVITEETWGGGSGDEAANNIRAWLAANYVSHSLAYVLLIGNPDPNTGDVPMKKVNPHGPGLACGNGYYDGTYGYIPTDYFYAELTGNWDLNGNGNWAELPGAVTGSDVAPGGFELNPELAVGRIPHYGNASELDAILAKIIAYQSATSGQGWRNKALLALEQFSDFQPDNPDYPYDPRQLFEGLKSSVLTPAGFSSYRIYNDLYQVSSPPELTPTSRENVVNAWNSQTPGLVVYAAQSLVTAYSYPFNALAAGSVIDTVSAEGLDDGHPAVVIQLAHDNAFPEEPGNLSYGLLKKGGVAVVGSTRGLDGYYCTDCSTPWTNAFYLPPHRRFDGAESFGYDLTELIVARKMSVGQALAERKGAVLGTWSNVNAVHALEFNLYGDPSTQLGVVASSQNLAAGKPAFASSSANSGFVPAHAVDGTISSAWKAASASGQWLQVDFGASKRYNAVVVNQVGSAITGFQIQNWSGSAWSTIYAGSSMGARVVALVTPVVGSKIRLQITGASSAPSISELEAYDLSNDVLAIEAEKMTLSNYSVEANAAASGGALVRVPTSGTGTARYALSGVSGSKDITVGYFDENDGAATYKLYVGNILRGSWTANKNLGSASPDAATLTSITFKNLQVNDGDELRIEGTANAGEYARVDAVWVVASRLGNQAPTVRTPAASSLTTVTGKTTTLTVLGDDDGGEANLFYTWEADGAAPGLVSFGNNMTNQAKQTVATFTAAGTYNLRAVITDAAGVTTTSAVSKPVVVKQVVSSLTIDPQDVQVSSYWTQQFNATALDQFGNPMPTPALVWSVSGGGTISSSGLFAAGPVAGGPFEVTASAGGIVGSSFVHVREAFAFEAENLVYTSNFGTRVPNEAGHSGGKAVELYSPTRAPASGDYLQFMLPITGGDYYVKIFFKSNNNRANVWMGPDGYCEREKPVFSEYAPTPQFQVGVDMGLCYFRPENTPNNYIQFSADGKVAESYGYTMLIDKIVLAPR